MRLVDIDELAKHEHWKNVVKALSCAPTVAPVVHGHWNLEKSGLSINPICSNCGEEPYRKNNHQLPKYCPNCGAKMEEIE